MESLLTVNLMLLPRCVFLTCGLAVGCVLCTATATAEDAVVFNRDIRPILSEYCYACHGPDANHREADLRLDDHDAAVDYGAIIPEAPEESLLVERIYSDSEELLMPPGDTGKKLTDEEKELLVAWIRQGAVYQNHWSFEPVPVSIPIPQATDDWPRGAIDRFVAEARRERSLPRAEESDRATWLRRVSFDLTGLPPSLPELDAFLADDADDAYETVVDRLLASPAYGERMANMWLDVARYADTFGYQNDVAMEVWPWRDWVINAFNRNMPYDQFITEQIAGDLLPQATQDQRLATAFNRLHRLTNEGGSIPEEFRLAGISDRTTTAGTAFLGLTLECCRCHDHKFDPIKQTDFYGLSAYFSDIDELGLYSHFTFAVPTPALLLYQDGQREQHVAAQHQVQLAQQHLERTMLAAREHWRKAAADLIDELPIPPEAVAHLSFDGTVDGIVGQATVCDGDQEYVCEGAPEFSRTSPFSFSIWVNPSIEQPRMLVLHQSVAAEDSGFRGLQLTIDSGHPEFSMIHFWPGNAVRVQTDAAIATNQWTHLVVTHDGSGKASGINIYLDGRLASVKIDRDGLTRDIRHRKEWGDMKVGAVKLAVGARFRDVGFRNGIVDELDVYDRQLSSAEVLAIYHSLATDSDSIADRNPLDLETALEHQVLTVDRSVRMARAELQKARDMENELVTGIREIMTMQHFPDASPTHLLRRGEYTAKEQEVRAGTPEFFAQLRASGESRLDLAEWITHPQNPLTSRVIANRIWHLFFGRGICTTLEDLGSQGTPPSHPELLDYLARSLMDHDWDLHSLCRQIVLSATYRQSSQVVDPMVYERDPGNVYLTRGPKHRLSAEQLRDAVLSASGSLVTTIGGPSVMPYQPEGLWEEAGTGKHYHQSTGAGLYRRSLYTYWKRTAPPPSMLTFDATSRESCTARRELTTTPLQALIFLNDPQYVEAARVLGEGLILEHQDRMDARWDSLFLQLISRRPTTNERQVLSALHREQLQYFHADASRCDALLGVGERPVTESVDQADLAATTIVVQTLFAYDETIMLR